MRKAILTLLLLCAAWAQAQDSLRVTELLRDGLRQPAATCLPLYYASQFLGIPYGAATLEVNKEERLVVNLQRLDCTTLVETVVALCLTTREKSTRYADFRRNLQRIRYRDGKLDGYASRNHYFSQWITSNERQGLVSEITSNKAPWTATQRLDLHYMTRHPDSYSGMRGDRAVQRLISQYEQEETGRTIRYIPHSQLQGDRQSPLGAVHDGDILAIVTRKDGLDVSHLGFAQWGADGKLHLLNASQIHKKVVLEPMTLHTYMQKHPTQLGIRVIRLK